MPRIYINPCIDTSHWTYVQYSMHISRKDMGNHPSLCVHYRAPPAPPLANIKINISYTKYYIPHTIYTVCLHIHMVSGSILKYKRLSIYTYIYIHVIIVYYIYMYICIYGIWLRSPGSPKRRPRGSGGRRGRPPSIRRSARLRCCKYTICTISIYVYICVYIDMSEFYYVMIYIYILYRYTTYCLYIYICTCICVCFVYIHIRLYI